MRDLFCDDCGQIIGQVAGDEPLPWIQCLDCIEEEWDEEWVAVEE